MTSAACRRKTFEDPSCVSGRGIGGRVERMEWTDRVFVVHTDQRTSDKIYQTRTIKYFEYIYYDDYCRERESSKRLNKLFIIIVIVAVTVARSLHGNQFMP